MSLKSEIHGSLQRNNIEEKEIQKSSSGVAVRPIPSPDSSIQFQTAIAEEVGDGRRQG